MSTDADYRIKRAVLLDFLRTADEQIEKYPGRVPFSRQEAHKVLLWLKTLAEATT